MSGGSYNYLTSARYLEDLLGKTSELEQMADRLEGLSEIEFPGSTAAGRMTRDLLAHIKLWDSHANVSATLLSDVWHDIEWWDSGDYSSDQARNGLRELLEKAPKTDLWAISDKSKES